MPIPTGVKQQLAELELIPDDWDGDTVMIPVDSLSGAGIEDLLEALILVADDTEIAANPQGQLRGIVVEAEVDKSRGTMATLLVMNGTMKPGDAIVAGTSYGKIKAMFDSAGTQVKQAIPSMPVAALGLDSPPPPGAMFEIVRNDKTARSIAEDRKRQAQERLSSSQADAAPTLEDLFKQFQAGHAKELAMVLKTDVQGSIQPITNELKHITKRNEEGIEIRVLAPGNRAHY